MKLHNSFGGSFPACVLCYVLFILCILLCGNLPCCLFFFGPFLGISLFLFSCILVLSLLHYVLLDSVAVL